MVKIRPIAAMFAGTPFRRADTSATAMNAMNATVDGYRNASTSRPSRQARMARMRPTPSSRPSDRLFVTVAIRGGIRPATT